MTSLLFIQIIKITKSLTKTMHTTVSREGERSQVSNRNWCSCQKGRPRSQSSSINSEGLSQAASSNPSPPEKQERHNKSQKSQGETCVQKPKHQNPVLEENKLFKKILVLLQLSQTTLFDILITLLIQVDIKRVYFLKNQKEDEDLSLAISIDPSELDEEMKQGMSKTKYFIVEDSSNIFKMEFDHRILIKFFKDKCFAKGSTVLWRYSFQSNLEKFAIFKREMSHYGVECFQVKGDLILINRTKSDQLSAIQEEKILQHMWENNKEEQSPLRGIESLSIDLTHQEKSRLQQDGIFKELHSKNKLQFIAGFKAQEKYILQVKLDENDDDLGNFLIGINGKISFQRLQINNEKMNNRIKSTHLNWSRDIRKPVRYQWMRFNQYPLWQSAIYYQIVHSECQFLRQATNILRKPDLIQFSHFWDQDLPEKVDYLIRNQEVYNQNLRQDLIQFVRVLEFKFSRYDYDSCSLFEKIYQGSQKLLQKLISFLKIKPLSEIIFNQKISTLTINNEPKTLNFLNDIRLNLSMQTNPCLENVFDTYYSESSGSSDLDKKIKTKINNQRDKAPYNAAMKRAYGQYSHHRDALALISHSQIHRKPEKNRSSLLIEVEKERLVEAKCIGCSSFFFHKANILDGSIHQTPIKVFEFVQQMRESQSQIKNSICSLLNGKGGILLFSCIENKQKILALGIDMTEKQKEEHEQRFMSYVQAFEPKVQAKKSVSISFVPLVQDPSQKKSPSDLSTYSGSESIFKSDEKYRVRSYLRGVFVMRIRVSSINPETVFFYKESNDYNIEQKYQNYTLSVMERGEIRSVKAKQLRKEIIKKMNKFYLPEKLSRNEKILARREESYFNHECRQPDTGISKSMIEAQSKNLMMRKKQSPFLNAAMILVKKNNHQQVIKNFKKLGIEVKIKVLFEEFNFSPAAHTAILYSNENFDKIYIKIKNNDNFIFNGRPLLMINITNYLKLTTKSEKQSFPQQTFLSLRRKIKAIMPYEKVRAFTFEPTDSAGSKIQYFLKCQTRESSLFAYYYLNHHNQKVIFKNPLHLDKMDEFEQQKRLKKIYPVRTEKEEEERFKKKEVYDQWIISEI